MEAFGLAASIITVVETSWKVIGFLEGVIHGGKSRRVLLEEVTLLWLVFRRLKEEIDLPTGKQAHQPWVEPLKVLDGPRGVSAQIREQLSDLEQQPTAPAGRFDEAMSSLRWPFQEKKVTRVSRLQELKQTTILVIQQSGQRMSREMVGELSQIKHVVDDTLLKKLLNWLTPLNFVQKHIIAGFLKQALQTQRDGKVLPKLKDHHSKAVTGAETQPLTLEALTGLLGEELKTYDETYIILDGFDEVSDISDRHAMVKAIYNIGGGVKVFITSRHSRDIAEALDATQTCKECHDLNAEVYWKSTDGACHIVCDQCQSSEILRGESKHMTAREREWESMVYRPRESDISSYVMTRIDADRDLRRLIGPDSGQDSLRKLAISTVTEKSEKIFLLARLHVDSLIDCLTLGALRRPLRDLTGDLDQMYTKSLERMEQSIRPKHYEILKKLLLWIAWGQRPLSISELGHALAIYPGIEDIDEEDVLPIREIAAWSAGVLFVDSDNILRSDRRAMFVIRKKQYPLIEYAALNFKHVARSGEKSEINRTCGFLLSDARKSFIQALHYLDSEWKDETEATALHVSVCFGATDVVSKLIDEGEELDARDSLGATPLMYAAARGNDGLSELKSLLKTGADPSITCKLGSTALIRAVKLSAQPLVAELMQQPDISINATPSSPAVHSALITATRLINTSIIKMLVARKDIDINLRNLYKVGECTPLHAAVYWRNLEAARCLLAHKDIKVNSRDLARNETPLFYSARVGLTDFMELLLDHGADINDEDNNSGNALMRAVDYEEREAVELLVNRGINTGHRDIYGRTALHSSSCNRSWRSMEYLLAHVPDIDVNARGRSGETPLHDSAWKLDARGASLLVDAGARCDIKNSDGQTPVDIVMLRNRPDILEIPKRAKGYIEKAPDARALVEAANVDKSSDYLQKALDGAVMDDRVAVTRGLVEAGSSMKRGVEGFPARDRAESRKALEMFEYFSALYVDQPVSA
ncbi:hypothetical protein CSOJ01_08026 [Colletotrichum sojae]|uniref:Ankyrin n=1 Tax=Colletotrichum sojae TaxID=2175907 RepID=A0A8H6MSM5_9PEZI|nr:hypothetical protein CSOJ01_08026 [Colletotrichum sojae]